jgi:hypothetical protein
MLNIFFRKTNTGLISASQPNLASLNDSNLHNPSTSELVVSTGFLAPGESRNDLSFDDEITLEVSTEGLNYFY